MTGFRGRVGIFEVMPLDSGLKQLIQTSAPESELREYLAKVGWRALREKALDVVDRGDSTLEEVLRVTRSETVDQPFAFPNASPAEDEAPPTGAATVAATSDVSQPAEVVL
jgi:hypothetical protein